MPMKVRLDAFYRSDVALQALRRLLSPSPFFAILRGLLAMACPKVLFRGSSFPASRRHGELRRGWDDSIGEISHVLSGW